MDELIHELRSYAHQRLFDGSEKYDQHILFLADQIEEEMANYVELPKDADGETIHIGDRVEDNERVARIVLTDGSWEPSVYIEKLPNVLHEYFCNEISHYHKPTVEDVLRDVVTLCHNTWKEESAFYFYDVDDVMESGNIAEYAAKLRLAGEE